MFPPAPRHVRCAITHCLAISENPIQNSAGFPKLYQYRIRCSRLEIAAMNSVIKITIYQKLINIPTAQLSRYTYHEMDSFT